MRFLSNFGCKIIFMCSVKFWHQQDFNSLFKGSIGCVTSQCKLSGLFGELGLAHEKFASKPGLSASGWLTNQKINTTHA